MSKCTTGRPGAGRAGGKAGKAPRPGRASVAQIVTDRICERLEAGVCPWRRTWKADSLEAYNLTTGKEYRGINFFLLNSLGFDVPAFLTFNQARTIGACVKKGSHGMPVVFWKVVPVEDKATGEVKKVPMLLRYSTVFNVEQVDNIPDKKLPIPDGATRGKVDPASVVPGYLGAPVIKLGGTVACYAPSSDEVRMPPPEAFEPRDAYWRVLYHELSHSTGAEKRLARPGITEGFGFASHGYGLEELLAEMGAAILCAKTGRDGKGDENSASYLAGWLRVLKQPKNTGLVMEAAGKAQKAVALILGESPRY